MRGVILMTKNRLKALVVIAVAGPLVMLLGMSGCDRGPEPGKVDDEAKIAKRAVDSFPAADEDYFHDMDQTAQGPVSLTADEIKGRNTWIVWTGGNDRLWDKLTEVSFGTLDFLKTISSHPSL